MLFFDPYSVVSKKIFSTYWTVFLKLRYHDTVAFRTKNWMDEKLVIDSLQTSHLPMWRGQTLSYHFQCPCGAMKCYHPLLWVFCSVATLVFFRPNIEFCFFSKTFGLFLFLRKGQMKFGFFGQLDFYADSADLKMIFSDFWVLEAF